MNDKLFNKCKSKNLIFKHVAEVGVYLPETSNVLNFIKADIRATLVEADPDYISKIKEYFNDFDSVTIYPYAVWDTNGTIILNKANSSSFVDELKSSPAQVNDNFISNDSDKISVEAKTFDKIDDGTIDLLSIDIEGGEWYVLKYLVSRPDVISVETHWKNYSNPFLKQIKEWMARNKYHTWYYDKSDTVFYKEGLFDLTVMEKIENKLKG